MENLVFFTVLCFRTRISVQSIFMYTRNFLDMDCQTQGRLKLMIELYISEICHKFQKPYWRAYLLLLVVPT
jgi:hypothetical protein